MSGTSLDGIDFALVSWDSSLQPTWINCGFIPYPEEWKQRLTNLFTGSALELAQTHSDLGKFYGEAAKDFLKGQAADLIACHGQTIFHQPHLGFTTQIGHPAQIAAITGIPVATDFRMNDVALGGQGAPLVPIGDQLLFNNYAACLNLGGFSNVSLVSNNSRVAFDCSPCNLPLNFLAAQKGASFDKNGSWAKSGNILPKLLKQLNALPYYTQVGPKSLGMEFVSKEILPLLNSKQTTEDLLRTMVEHIAFQIGRNLPSSGEVLVTGGGAKNDFLIERIQSFTTSTLVIPDDRLVDYKEALIFSLLGYLRLKKIPNSLASVTGATRNSVGGSLTLP